MPLKHQIDSYKKRISEEGSEVLASLILLKALSAKRFAVWWRSSVRGKGISVKRSKWDAAAEQELSVDIPSVAKRRTSATNNFLFIDPRTRSAEDPYMDPLYSIGKAVTADLLARINSLADSAFIPIILISSAFLLLAAGLEASIQTLSDSHREMASLFGNMAICAYGLAIFAGISLMAFGAALSLARRHHKGLFMVFTGYAFIICPVMVATGQCGYALPILVGCIGTGVAFLSFFFQTAP